MKKTLEESIKRGIDLRQINLRRIDFQEMDLKGANFRGVDLRGVDFRGVDFRGVDLREVDFWGTNIRGLKGLKIYWHIHHLILVESLTEPLKNRIEYIKKNKPKEEVKLRLKLIKKIKCKPEDYPTNEEEWEALHKKECGCEWDGQTIFTEKNKKRKEMLEDLKQL